MPKILIAVSDKNKKDRKAETSAQRMKELIKKRVEKDPEDNSYTVVTLNAYMKLAVVRSLINTSLKKLSELEGVISTEKYSYDLEKGRFKVEAK